MPWSELFLGADRKAQRDQTYFEQMMETRLELAALVTGALFAGVFAYRFAGRHWRRRNWFLSAACLALAWPVLVKVFPDRLYFLYPAFPHGEFLFCTGFLFVGAYFRIYGGESRKRILGGVLAVVLAYDVFAEPIHLALDGEEIRALHLRVDRGVTVQAAFFTCVPASLATVLRTWGSDYSEGELAYGLRTAFQGTSVARLPYFVEHMPGERRMQAKVVETNFDELAKFDLPAILVGKAGPLRHAVALVSLNADFVEIGDPLKGRLRVLRSELDRSFQWEGQAVIVAPDFLHQIDPTDNSPHAAKLARSLARLGYAASRRGVEEFQRRNGLAQTGLFDWRTILVLDAISGGHRPSLVRAAG